MATLHDMEIFARVVELDGFSAAARGLGVSRSYVSKRVMALEEQLGVRLLQRTTRKLSLTQEGEVYLGRVSRIMADVEEASASVAVMQSSPRGVLRLSAPLTFGQEVLMPIVSAFVALHGGLSVDVVLTDRHVDLVEEGYDMAIRVASLSDSSLIARRLAPVDRCLCASPAYLAARGVPEHPKELKGHDCLIYQHERVGDRWRFERGGEEVVVKVSGRVRSNNGEALRVAAVAGLGFAMLPRFIVGRAIERGELVLALEGWCNWDAAVWAIYPHGRHLSARVRLFVDYVVERLAAARGEAQGA